MTSTCGELGSLMSHNRRYSLFFGTFDGIVLMASIYLLFPNEQPELISTAMQHLQWGIERFEAMSERNALARAALGVLRAIRVRLGKVFGSAAHQSPLTNTDTSKKVITTQDGMYDHISPLGGSTAMPDTQAMSTPTGSTSTSLSNGLTPGIGSHPSMNGGYDWSLPSDFDWSAIQPIFATGDLVYNDLVCIPDEQGGVAGYDGVAAQHQQQPWHFEGGFGNDSVWNLLNQCSPF